MSSFPVVNAASLKRATVRFGSFVGALLLATACVTNPTLAAPSSAPGVSASPIASPSPATSALTASNRTGASAAATPAIPPATTDVSPSQLQVGSVTVSMGLEPARHMVAQNAALKTDPDPTHLDNIPTGANDTVGSTALVLDGLLQLTNNVDPSQPVPDDQLQAMVRHVNVQIRGADLARPVPYLTTSLDMLLDGRPVISNVALEPMLAAESSSPEMYYGNNLKLTQRGTYQVFVRVQPSALLGKAPPPTAQFTVVVR
jgi:uncharacterized protein involved in high-affinity Fe2+ transport